MSNSKKILITVLIGLWCSIIVVVVAGIARNRQVQVQTTLQDDTRSSTSTIIPVSTPLATAVIDTSAPPADNSNSTNLRVTKDEAIFTIDNLLKAYGYETLNEPIKNQGGGLTCSLSDGSAYGIQFDEDDYVTEVKFFTSLKAKADYELSEKDINCMLILQAAVFDDGGNVDPDFTKFLERAIIGSGSEQDIVLSYEDEAIVKNAICKYTHVCTLGQILIIKLN